MIVEEGKIYIDENGLSRKLVLSINGNNLIYMFPISLKRVSTTVSDFQAWAAAEWVAPVL